ncbi:MAG: hypothetical protein CMO01_12795 [Thalassobius sp.]|nr:hypothetical protein [Thalassovita sp.]
MKPIDIFLAIFLSTIFFSCGNSESTVKENVNDSDTLSINHQESIVTETIDKEEKQSILSDTTSFEYLLDLSKLAEMKGPQPIPINLKDKFLSDFEEELQAYKLHKQNDSEVWIEVAIPYQAVEEGTYSESVSYTFLVVFDVSGKLLDKVMISKKMEVADDGSTKTEEIASQIIGDTLIITNTEKEEGYLGEYGNSEWGAINEISILDTLVWERASKKFL